MRMSAPGLASAIEHKALRAGMIRIIDDVKSRRSIASPWPGSPHNSSIPATGYFGFVPDVFKAVRQLPGSRYRVAGGRTVSSNRNDSFERGVGLNALVCRGPRIESATAAGRFEFGVVVALAEFERDVFRECTMSGLAAARARGRQRGGKSGPTKARIRFRALRPPRCRSSEFHLAMGPRDRGDVDEYL